MAMAEDGCVGLGFGGGSHGRSASEADASTSVADSLMRSYMDQCLEYHHQQEEGATLNQNRTAATLQGQQSTANASAAFTFVPATQPRDATNVANMSDADRLEAQRQEQARREKATENARSIALRFHEQRQQQQQREVHTLAQTSSATMALPAVISVPQHQHCHTTPAECRAKREQHAEQHRRRLHLALLKNFEYVARRDEEGMRAHAEELERRKIVSANIAAMTDMELERRKEAAASEGAAAGAKSRSGIGTTSRNRIENRNQRERAGSKSSDMSNSVYLTGLPVDGSVTDSELRQLFGCYGTVRRVVLYTHKSSGRLKGDGLVAYEPPRDKKLGKGQSLAMVSEVCTQLNGVELPCGAKLGVEPADADYKVKPREKGGEPPKKEDDGGSQVASGAGSTSYCGPATSSRGIVANAASTGHSKDRAVADGKAAGGNGMEANGGGDDLDDFFASLT